MHKSGGGLHSERSPNISICTSTAKQQKRPRGHHTVRINMHKNTQTHCKPQSCTNEMMIQAAGQCVFELSGKCLRRFDRMATDGWSTVF